MAASHKPVAEDGKPPTVPPTSDSAAKTLIDVDLLRDDVGASRFRWCGYLSPMKESGRGRAIPVDGGSFTLGRDSACSCILADQTVSRRHAVIVQDGREFTVHDLNSTSGTYVNNVRILSSKLSDGDLLRLGSGVVFFFDRGTVPAVKSSIRAEQKPPQLPAISYDGLIVRFWGTRGSIPTPGVATEKFGGNTTCAEVRLGKTRLILDAGTGLRELSESWSSNAEEEVSEATLLLTHLHWDHIQGFPFFSQAYSPSHKIEVIGPTLEGASFDEYLRRQMQGKYFPVPMEAMKANLEFLDCRENFKVSGLKVRSLQLPHPGGSYAYRIESKHEVFVFATDCELDQIAKNRADIDHDFGLPRVYDAEFLEFFADVDLLALDCQWTDAEYSSRKNWGHNSVTTAADFASQVRPKSMALTHHDPRSTDAIVAAIVEQVRSRITKGPNVLVFGAREGMCVRVSSESPETDRKKPAHRPPHR
jgi:phosphoribosyl 1,2-cyclic phosphodiesterase